MICSPASRMIATNGMFFHESATKMTTHDRHTLAFSQVMLDQAGWIAPRKESTKPARGSNRVFHSSRETTGGPDPGARTAARVSAGPRDARHIAASMASHTHV